MMHAFIFLHNLSSIFRVNLSYFFVPIPLFLLTYKLDTTVKESDSDTIIMVIVLVAGVGGVFILFALMALCYRYKKSYISVIIAT